MQNSIYIYAYDSQKPLYFLEEKISLFKPIQVVWRYTWKAEIVSTRPSITWRASWTWYPYFIWCFSNPVAPRKKKEESISVTCSFFKISLSLSTWSHIDVWWHFQKCVIFRKTLKVTSISYFSSNLFYISYFKNTFFLSKLISC